MNSPQHPLRNGRTNRTAALICLICAGGSAAVCQTFGGLPTNAIVEMRFSEGTGTSTANDGTMGGTASFYDVQASGFPLFTNNVPVGTYTPTNNLYSVDFGPNSGNSTAGTGGRAVDLTTATGPFGTVGGMPQLTICGWLNARTVQAGSGGNRIAFALESPGGLGFDLVQRGNGQLALCVNEYNINSPESTFGKIPADPLMGTNNWVFFAVTYNPSLGTEQLKYYFGNATKLAELDVARNYSGGSTNSIDFTGQLTIGNFGTVEAARDGMGGTGSRVFRGLIDELRVYTNALTIDEIQQAQLDGPVPAVAVSITQQPSSITVPQGQDAGFSVVANGSGLLTYQWKTNSVDVPGATNATFTITAVTLADIGKTVRVGVSNSLGGVLSSSATLTVVPANPHLIWSSFVEGTSTNPAVSAFPASILNNNQYTNNINTENVGLLGSRGRFFQKAAGSSAGTYPVFSPNVPSGPFAPSPLYNLFSLNMGDVQSGAAVPSNQGGRAVDYTNAISSPLNSLGNMSGVTVCGWINSGSQNFRGTVGNQVVYALASGDANGFGLAHKDDGSFQFAVNESTGGSTANRSSTAKIPVDTNHPPANWIFFAVTYDGSLTTGNLSFYFGDPNNLATNDVTRDYNKGIINSTGPLTVGNYNTAYSLSGRLINGTTAGFCRGLLDEIHVFSRVLSLAEIRQMQIAPAAPALLRLEKQTNNVVLSWEAGQQPLLPALQLQSRSNLLTTDGWADVTAATNVAGQIRSISLPATNNSGFFKLRVK